MESLCGPGSPETYVKEVSQVYSAGWPPAFLGDLHYYIGEFDLRERAGEIDTNRCAVHLLSGEYDWSATTEMGVQAHEAIDGSTHAVMPGVGHFPMQENPREFLRYLLPVLDRIRAAATVPS
jgi:pimeloyl-ACP methyl ester carboxylesterase